MKLMSITCVAFCLVSGCGNPTNSSSKERGLTSRSGADSEVDSALKEMKTFLETHTLNEYIAKYFPELYRDDASKIDNALTVLSIPKQTMLGFLDGDASTSRLQL